MEQYIRELFTDSNMLSMGHGQRLEDLNLGLGWVYYALARVVRPARSVVIGSYRGFVPSVLAKAMLDNVEAGEVVFIDPSYVDDFWADPEQVAAHFQRLGTPNVKHYRHTTQSFTTTEDYAKLTDIGLLMVDGYHSAEQARYDYLAFLDKLAERSIVLFHDSVSAKTSGIYGEDSKYVYSVFRLVERLRRTPGLETYTFPFAEGLTLVQGRPKNLDIVNAAFDAE